jgi:hypothetical protein
LTGNLALAENQQLKERRVIAVFVKDRRAAVPTIQDVIGMTADLSARNTRHDGGKVPKYASL